jgi:DNA polymerase-3 subunit beta
MKTKILQEKLQLAINQVEKITGKDATLPILGNILLKAENNSLTALATNLETGILWKILSKTEENGDVAIPAQTFSSLVGSLPGGVVNIETQGNSISITSERRRSNLNGLPADEFPIIPINTEGEYLTIRADLLCQALSQVVNFTGTSSIKPEITGVYAMFLKDCIKIVATDSFRLGEKTISITKHNTLSKDYSIIIPLRAVREIISIFGDKQKNINIYFINNQITIDFLVDDDIDQPRIQFISRLIEGEFPDYQAIIPAAYTANIVFSKKELLNHLKSAGLFSGKNNEVGVKISGKDLLMEISSQSADLGKYESELKLESASGKDVSIVFNCRFLIEGLNAIKNDKCIFEFSADDGPGVLKPADDQSFIYILMPIKKY